MAQHTLEVLNTVYSVLEDICVQKGIANPDICKALRWCQQAHLNQAVYFHRRGRQGTDAKGKRYSVKVPTRPAAQEI